MAAIHKVDTIQNQIRHTAYAVLIPLNVFLLYLQKHIRKDARVAEEARLESV